MVNLIIDGNYLLNTTIGYLYKDKKVYDPANFETVPKTALWIETMMEQFMTVVITRLKDYADWDTIYLVSDTKVNWRKSYYPEYKGTRKKTMEIDWDWVWEVYNRWLDNMPNYIKKLHVYNTEGLEADDWCTFLSMESMQNGISSVIASKDGDFKQLVKSDWKTGAWTILWKDYSMSKTFSWALPNDIKVLEKSVKIESDIFNRDKNTQWELLHKIIQEGTVEEIDCNQFLFIKLIQGDRGDNVPSIYHKTQNLKAGGTRQVGIGESSANKIWKSWEALYINPPDFLKDDWIPILAEMALDQMGLEEDQILEKSEAVQKSLIRNRKLMHLHPRWIPKELKDQVIARGTLLKS